MNPTSTMRPNNNSSSQVKTNPSQISNYPRDTMTQFVNIPSQSQPNWGSYFTIKLTQNNCYLHDVVLDFYITAITGFTGSGTNVPRFTPAPFFIQKMDIAVSNGGPVLTTLYGDLIFQKMQLFSDEFQRLYENKQTGDYASPSQRAASAAVASHYYVPIKSFIQTCHLPILSSQTQLELRIWMNPLSTVAITTGLTLSALSATINSCNAIVKLTHMSPSLIQAVSNDIALSKKYLFSEPKYAGYSINTGISSFTANLTNIVGKVSSLFFVIRPTSGIIGDGLFTFSDIITSFEIQNSSSTNIVGGQAILANFNRTEMMKHWIKSYYLLDYFNGVSAASIFMYSFSSMPYDSMISGKDFGSYSFTGNETLKLVLNTTTSQTYQLDLYAFTQAGLILTPNSLQKVPM